MLPENSVAVGVRIDQEHCGFCDEPAAGVFVIKGVQLFGKLRVDIGVEMKRQIEPLTKLGMILRLLVGHGDKVDAEAANLPVVLTQLRQIESSGWSPITPVEMHKQWTAGCESSK